MFGRTTVKVCKEGNIARADAWNCKDIFSSLRGQRSERCLRFGAAMSTLGIVNATGPIKVRLVREAQVILRNSIEVAKHNVLRAEQVLMKLRTRSVYFGPCILRNLILEGTKDKRSIFSTRRPVRLSRSRSEGPSDTSATTPTLS
jgi:hypothetical protein